MNENEPNSTPLDGTKARGRQPKKILMRVYLTLSEVRDLGKLQIKLMSETGKETDRDRVIGYAVSIVARNYKAGDEPIERTFRTSRVGFPRIRARSPSTGLGKEQFGDAS